MINPLKYARCLFAFSIFLAVFSCEKGNFNRLGFNSSFSKNSERLVLIRIDKNSEFIMLDGEIFVKTGGIEVQLINAENQTIYFVTFDSAVRNRISKIIPAAKGIWKLKYTSINGTGIIDLHGIY
jgi:hypothetical protein